MNTDELHRICKAGLENPVRDNPLFALCTGAALEILFTDAVEKDLICILGDIDTK